MQLNLVTMCCNPPCWNAVLWHHWVKDCERSIQLNTLVAHFLGWWRLLLLNIDSTEALWLTTDSEFDARNHQSNGIKYSHRLHTELTEIGAALLRLTYDMVTAVLRMSLCEGSCAALLTSDFASCFWVWFTGRYMTVTGESGWCDAFSISRLRLCACRAFSKVCHKALGLNVIWTHKGVLRRGHRFARRIPVSRSAFHHLSLESWW